MGNTTENSVSRVYIYHNKRFGCTTGSTASGRRSDKTDRYRKRNRAADGKGATFSSGIWRLGTAGSDVRRGDRTVCCSCDLEPLQGKEGCIRKIDRHKRKAWLEVELFGDRQLVEVGLEIVTKTI